MLHHFMSHHLSPLKNNSKNKKNQLMPHHHSPLENNSENSSSMPRHISLLKKNSKNLKKLSHATTPLSVEK
jgi:hypothetical protein